MAEHDKGTNKPLSPFSIRFTKEERARLEKAAGSRTLGAYIRDRLLSEDVGRRRVRGREPIKDHEALARVLSRLGQSEIYSSLRDLAFAAKIGALPVNPDTERRLEDACVHIAMMRADLVRALGLHEGPR